jgi:hypothetical protein
MMRLRRRYGCVTPLEPRTSVLEGGLLLDDGQVAMDQIRETVRERRIQVLTAQLESRRIEEVSLSREIESSATPRERRVEAICRRAFISVEREFIVNELAALDPPLRVSAWME